MSLPKGAVIFTSQAFRKSSSARVLFSLFAAAVVAEALPALLTITSGPVLPVAFNGQPYSFQLAATGGASPYFWSLDGQPSWLTVSQGGLLTGTPVGVPAGTQYSFAVLVSDSLENSAQTTVTITVRSNLAIQPSSVTLPATEVGNQISYPFSASGGSGNYSWSMQGAPAWASISSSGVLSGVPSSSGQFSFTVVVTSGADSASGVVAVTVYPAVTVGSGTLPTGTVNTAYSQQISASGGPGGPYALSASGLPPGLAFDNGSISGTPTAAGQYSIQVTAKDTAGFTATGTYSLTILAAVPALAITTTALPQGAVGTAYSQMLGATGGSGGYTWSATGLPGWLTLSGGGQLSGTPTAPGAITFTATVRDSSGNTASASLSFQVSASLQITTSTLPDGVVETPYNATLSASGSAGPVTWSQTAGTLPSGLKLSSTGSITGTPDTAGDSSFTVQAVDATNTPVTATLQIHIAAPPPSTLTATLPNVLTAGSQSAITISITPAYPLPLNLSAGLAIAPDLNGATDLGFANGQRTIQFTIPANTAQYQLPFSTGTSAGSITATLTLTTTGQSITVSGPLVLTGQISSQPPSIRDVTATADRNASRITVVVTGFSSTRDMKTAQFHFTPVQGSTLASSDFTVDVSSVFTTWYANPASFATGSQFKLTVPFTIGGDVGTIGSVTVTLTNSNATSSPVTATVH